MNLYPIHVNLSGKRCVMIGAGRVAERKVESLRAQGGVIRLIAPQATPPLRELAEAGALTWMRNMYTAAHLDEAFLVIAATDFSEINAAVTRDAQARNLLVCNTDDPEDGNFIVPGTITRGDLIITVSTSGASPTLAAVLRERLSQEYGEGWGALAALFRNLRPLIQTIGDESSRKAAVRRIIQSENLFSLLQQGELLEAEAQARACLLSSSG